MKKKHVVILTIFISGLFLFINTILKTPIGKYISYNILFDNALTTEEILWLQNSDDLIYGADENSPPLMFIDEETSQYSGFTIDYINALSIEIGKEIKTKSYIWDVALDKLAKGETDICDMFPSEERAKLYDFSEPIYTLKSIIMTSSSNLLINHFEDLEEKTVAIPKGDYGIEFLNEKLTKIRFIYTNNVEDAIKEVLAGNADAALGDEPVAAYYVKKHKLFDNIRIMEDVVYESEVVLAVTKGNTILLNIINKSISNLENKQVISQIQQKWFGISDALRIIRFSEKIFVIISVFLIILLISSYISYRWNRSLKSQVDFRTKELRVSREKLRITFDSITDFIFVMNNDNKVDDVNLSFIDYIDKDRDSVIGKDIGDYFSEKVCCEIKELLKNTFDTQSNRVKEIIYENKIYDAKTFLLKKNSLELNKVILMIEDITNERIIEKQILHSTKMAAIGQLAAGVAHEIRNPLGLIRNYSYFIEEKIDQSDDTIKKAIKVIGESVEKTSNIIDNLLNFSRIFDEKYEETNIRQFVEKIVHLGKSVFEKSNIRYCIECDTNLKFVINKESFKHIIINLIGNAIDAMPDGGEIHLNVYKNDKYFIFICKDTGVGIERENLDFIFNPFYTKKISGKGTGLGLYIVYNEINKFGGEIFVTSELGKGSVFTIQIPLKPV